MQQNIDFYGNSRQFQKKLSILDSEHLSICISECIHVNETLWDLKNKIK